jgi:hypothetical protein
VWLPEHDYRHEIFSVLHLSESKVKGTALFKLPQSLRCDSGCM